MNIPIPVAVAIGGCVGAVLRHAISSGVTSAAGETQAHWGTLVVNLTGCFLIGLLVTLADRIAWLTPAVQKCLITGLLGALTTFSTFALDTLRLLNEGRLTAAVASVAANLLVGILLVWLGMRTADTILPPASPSPNIPPQVQK